MNQKVKTTVWLSGRRWLSAGAMTVLIAAGLLSCVGEKPVSQARGTVPMRMRTTALESTQSATKAVITDFSTIKDVGVYGYYTKDERWVWSKINAPATLFANEFCNMPLNKGNGWTYSPLRYWPIDTRNKISFFAYSPHFYGVWNTGGGSLDKTPNTDTENALPELLVKVDTMINQQIDLMWDAKIDRTWQDNGGVVDFNMKHALSGIKFSAQIADQEQLDKGYCVVVTSISIEGVHGDGVLSLDNGTWRYNDISPDWLGHYTMTQADGMVVADDISGRNHVLGAPGNLDVHPLLTGAAGILMVLPQTLTSEAVITVMLQFTKPGLSLEIPFPVALKDITPVWEAGKIIDYRLFINDDFITIHTSAIPWVSGGSIDVVEDL